MIGAVKRLLDRDKPTCASCGSRQSTRLRWTGVEVGRLIRTELVCERCRRRYYDAVRKLVFEGDA